MNRNEIVRQYKWLRILRVFLKIFSFIFAWLLGPILLIAPFAIAGLIIMLGKSLDAHLGMNEPFFSWIFLLIVLLPLLIVLVKTKEFENKTMSIFINELSNRHYEKKWGMTEIEIKDYISRRGSLGDKPNRYVLPYVSRLCRLNGEGRQSQEAFLSDWFSEDEIAHVFATDYTDPQIEELNRRWRKESLSCRKSLMELLFKLAIVQDGIHNDEWNMLMSLMTQLKFNKNYFDFFKKRYSSLRTEFDEYEYKRSASTEDHSVSNLKPYFELLGLDKNATDEEIKRAYHNLALLHHPDLPKNSARIEECETLMTKINEAYEKVRR